jgi:peptidoglycan hydrolase-like protein with peptidoglycan-binding domain
MALAGFLVFSVFAASAAGAAGTRQEAAALNDPARLVVTHISLSLAVPAVKAGEVTTIRALVQPRTAGRIVFLRRQRDRQFFNLRFARTNRKGVAVFRCAFNTKGKVFLRASVRAAARLRGATSVPAIENVYRESPLILTPNPTLAEGSTGKEVLLLQQRLSALGYWLGTPDGYFGDSTQQAVYALEKAAGIDRTGIVDAQFVAALNEGIVPRPRTTSGDAIDVDLGDDLLMFVKNGALQYVLNTSTGGGYTYTEDGVTNVAITPQGVFSIGRAVDGWVIDTLGALWRPRFFYEGFAIHGDTYVPAFPVSHGCVRVSDEAIDWIWAENLAPIGLTVWIY